RAQLPLCSKTESHHVVAREKSRLVRYRKFALPDLATLVSLSSIKDRRLLQTLASKNARSHFQVGDSWHRSDKVSFPSNLKNKGSPHSRRDFSVTAVRQEMVSFSQSRRGQDLITWERIEPRHHRRGNIHRNPKTPIPCNRQRFISTARRSWYRLTFH